MKKIPFLILLCFFSLPLFAQLTLSISGTVTEINSGNPLPQYAVSIYSDSSGGFVYNSLVYTNENGYYSETIALNPAVGAGILIVSVTDCQQFVHSVALSFDSANLSLVQNFQICAIPVDCEAAFTYANPEPLTFQFFDQSSGGSGLRAWDFGDSAASTLQNPVHTYSATGLYTVTLSIGAPGTNCWDQQSMTIQAGDSIPSGCQAYFTAYQDPALPGAASFDDQSTGNISTWIWDFGDNTVVTITAPGNPDLTHQYNGPGSYYVCLTVHGADSLCSASYCSVIIVDSIFSPCQAGFTFMQLPGASAETIQFSDQSVAPGNINWLWNFGDPASGMNNNSALQNPVHTFPALPYPTSYNVCLTITTGDSTCYNTICLPVLIGGQQGCIADFEALRSPNALTTFLFNDLSQGNIQTWTWDFGDGNTQVITSPGNPDVTHTYAVPGFYTACLFIQGSDSLCSSVKCEIIPAGDTIQSCQAQYTFYQDSTAGGSTFQFIDLSLGAPEQWYWDFGDPASGNANISAQQNPVHVFSAPGTYYVCLTISGPQCQSVWCVNIEVGDPSGCTSYFTYSQIGLDVNFQGYMLYGQGDEYVWDFGDNQTGTGQNILHTYGLQGTYFVTLTTTDSANGCSYTSSQVISVGDSTIWGQLYGQVFAGTFPLSQGVVLLFSIDTTNAFMPFVQVSAIDSSGVYYFPMVPQGNYVIYAIPFVEGYLPTYYGNTLYWQNAAVISLGAPDNPYNIDLVSGYGYQDGSGSISGQVSQGDYSGSMIDKITMLLDDADGNTILFSQVDETGQFDFPALALGTYYLYAELAGCESQPIMIEITDASPEAVIMLTLSGNNILGKEEIPLTLEAGSVFPNPVMTDAHIHVDLKSPSAVQIELYNMSGRLEYSINESASTGQSTFTIPAGNLINGLYLLKLRTADGYMITRKLLVAK